MTLGPDTADLIDGGLIEEIEIGALLEDGYIVEASDGAGEIRSIEDVASLEDLGLDPVTAAEQLGEMVTVTSPSGFVVGEFNP